MIKKALPNETRRVIARAHGCTPYRTVPAHCTYCGAPGKIHWANRSWVSLTALEFDHVIPEAHGGDGSPANIVLACRRCNRRKGNKLNWTPS